MHAELVAVQRSRSALALRTAVLQCGKWVQDPQAALHLVSRLMATEAMDQPTFIRRRALHQARDAQGGPRSDAIREALAPSTRCRTTRSSSTPSSSFCVLCPYLVNRLLEIAANAYDGQIPALVFDTPLTACRVMKHFTMHERFPTENELAVYGVMIANTNDASIFADVEEGARCRGVPTSDCLGAVVHMSGPSGGPSVAIAWPLDSWRMIRSSSLD